MRHIFFILVLISNICEASPSITPVVDWTTCPTITCPADKTAATNTDAISNYNCSSTLTGLTPTLVDPDGLANIRYQLFFATTGSGNGSVNGLTFNNGYTKIKYSLSGSNCIDTTTSSHRCFTNVVMSDAEAPRRSSTLSQAQSLIYDGCTLYPGSGFKLITPMQVTEDNCTITTISKKSAVIQKATLSTVANCTGAAKASKFTQRLTRTWLVTDEAGNTSTFTQFVTIRDSTVGVVILQNLSYTKQGTTRTITASTWNNGSYDACGGTLSFAGCKNDTPTCTGFASSLAYTSTEQNTNVGTPKNVRIRLTDACGNVSYGTCTVTFN